MENTCNRGEVQSIVDKSNEAFQTTINGQVASILDELKEMKDDRDKRMKEIARTEIAIAKDNLLRYIGFGGFVAVLTLVWYGGGLTKDVEYLTNTVEQTSEALKDMNSEMNSTDRFTIDDGNSLKKYIDQQDEYVLKRVDDGFLTLGKQIEQMHTTK